LVVVALEQCWRELSTLSYTLLCEEASAELSFPFDYCKILESIIKDHIEPTLTNVQNPMQRGFTAETSPIYAAVVTTEGKFSVLLECCNPFLLHLTGLQCN
jgi:hypothetical protein